MPITYGGDNPNFPQIQPVQPVVVGAMMPYAGSTVPEGGYLFCDGDTDLDSVADPALAPLFAVIGTTYGGTGASNFDLPDMRGRTVCGLDNLGGSSANRITNSSADNLGGTMGEEKHTQTQGEMDNHNHTVALRAVASDNLIGGGLPRLDEGNTNTGGRGSNNPHNVVQPTIFVPWIIKC